MALPPPRVDRGSEKVDLVAPAPAALTTIGSSRRMRDLHSAKSGCTLRLLASLGAL